MAKLSEAQQEILDLLKKRRTRWFSAAEIEIRDPRAAGTALKGLYLRGLVHRRVVSLRIGRRDQWTPMYQIRED